ncbi:MAG: hypothetical protein IJQ28_05315, partial [Clostridia bacterium]|nr:hypothetical protein [Clostridia bacterium]
IYLPEFGENTEYVVTESFSALFKDSEDASWFISNDAYSLIEEDGNEDLLNATIHYNYKPYTTTSVSVKDGQKTFTISPNGIKLNDAVILALYKGGVFIGLQNAIYNGEDIIFKTDKDYDKAKIMVWGSLTDLKPVTNAEVK